MNWMVWGINVSLQVQQKITDALYFEVYHSFGVLWGF